MIQPEDFSLFKTRDTFQNVQCTYRTLCGMVVRVYGLQQGASVTMPFIKLGVQSKYFDENKPAIKSLLAFPYPIDTVNISAITMRSDITLIASAFKKHNIEDFMLVGVNLNLISEKRLFKILKPNFSLIFNRANKVILTVEDNSFIDIKLLNFLSTYDYPKRLEIKKQLPQLHLTRFLNLTEVKFILINNISRKDRAHSFFKYTIFLRELFSHSSLRLLDINNSSQVSYFHYLLGLAYSSASKINKNLKLILLTNCDRPKFHYFPNNLLRMIHLIHPKSYFNTFILTTYKAQNFEKWFSWRYFATALVREGRIFNHVAPRIKYPGELFTFLKQNVIYESS